MRPLQIEFFCPRWGSEALHWEDFFIKLRLAGYEGMEWAISRETGRREMDEVFSLAAQYRLKVIAQHYDTCEGNFYAHLDQYARWLEKISDYPILKLNSQTGRDFFSFADNKTLIDLAAEFGREQGIQVCHETHRSKFSFAAHITKEYLSAIPSLQLTLDASHWVCVAESFLFDQQQTMELATARTGHIHARVGYTQGPQVSHPASKEWQQALNIHLKWWDRAIAKQSREVQKGPITITPESGPYPYMVRNLKGAAPAGQWEINVWMMDLLRTRYSQFQTKTEHLQ